jgi:Flp pilus assembly pilin Flp
MNFGERAQTTIEFALVLIILSAAVIGAMLVVVEDLNMLYEEASTLVGEAVAWLQE